MPRRRASGKRLPPAPLLAPPPRLPRRGRPLAESLALTEHCVERYRVRAERPARAPVTDLRAELTELIAASGAVVKRPPSWFFGTRGATAFYVTIDGQLVLPAQRARPRDGIVPARPFVATTFISRVMSAADLAGYTGEELAALINLPSRVVAIWSHAAEPSSEPAEQRLRDAIAATGRAHADTPDRLSAPRAAPNRFFVSLDDGTLLVVSRARRDEGHKAPFRAIDLLQA